ncbi:MAG: hypothetical protein JNM69_40255 [Archangium sp.]|nr:hypothetical protein [Archangium sp.]
MARITMAVSCAALLVGLACGTNTPTTPKAGEPCKDENVGACESATRLLACRSLVWAVVSDCKGADGCRRVGDTVDCDTRGNGVGDFCSNPGRVRCDPDGGLQILRCNQSGVLAVEFSCPATPTQTSCVLGDAGLTCL